MAPVDDNSPKKSDSDEDDPPIVVDLKKLDDKYLALHREYQREKQALLRQFKEKQEPLLKERLTVLSAPPADSEDPSADMKFGTPACRDFWGEALRNAIRSLDPDLELVEDYDMEVLEYLKDITVELAPDADNSNVDTEVEPKDRGPSLGYTLKFHFVENPFFTNELLQVDYKVEEANPYCGDFGCESIKSTEVQWKAGKDITVQKARKKAKSGKERSKKKSDAQEDRRSFFRFFFRTLEGDSEEAPKDLESLYPELVFDEDDEESDQEFEDMQIFCDSHMEVGDSIKDMLVPFAVRCYTGEVVDDESDYDEDEESEEEDDDDSDDASSGRGKRSGRGRKPAVLTSSKKEDKKEGGKKDKAASGDKPKEEECKQQ